MKATRAAAGATPFVTKPICAGISAIHFVSSVPQHCRHARRSTAEEPACDARINAMRTTGLDPVENQS